MNELDEVTGLLRLNYREITRYQSGSWTLRLEYAKRHFIRGEIVLQYTLIDEYLNNILCRYFFGRSANFVRLWRTTRFRNFNYFVIEKLSLMEKLAFVRTLRELPRSVRQEIERLNSVRNGIAHAFFPENLRGAKPTWKGLDLFSVGGIQRFVDDMGQLSGYFRTRPEARP